MDEERRPVGHEGGQAVAGPQTELEVAGGQAVALLLQLLPGEPAIPGDQRGLVRPLLEPASEQVEQVGGVVEWRA